MRTASAVWRSSPELVLALDEHFGPPVDSYVNGSQTWLLDNGPGGAALEWRLHPVASARHQRTLAPASRAVSVAMPRPQKSGATR